MFFERKPVTRAFFKSLSTAVIVTLMNGCAGMAPVKSEIPHVQSDLNAKSTRPNEIMLVLFNTSNKLLFGLDNTGRLNAWLDGKAIGGPNISEYVQIQIPKATHQLMLVHPDIFEFRTTHEIDAQDDPRFLEIRATAVSNEIQVHKSLPAASYLPQPFTRFVHQ